MNTKTTRRELMMACGSLTALALAGESRAASPAPEVSMFQIDADWQVRVNKGTAQVGKSHYRIREAVTLAVSPAALLSIHNERVDKLPAYDAGAAPWARGYRPEKLVTFETTACDMLVPASVALRLRQTDADTLTPKRDYEFEPRWGTIGFTAGGRAEGRSVFIDYDCGLSRIDSIVIDPKGVLSIREGKPHAATPRPPDLENGETAIANVWVPGRTVKLTEDNIYPILEPRYPEPRRSPEAAKLLPKSWEKLRSGAPLSIMAWGDSVTAGGQASDPAHRYQNLFVEAIKEKFPQSRPTLITVGWGGRNSDSFLAEPRESEFNFDRAVIGSKPDLIVMEFVNDAGMAPDIVEKKYSYLLSRLNEIGAELIILTPHFVRPDWMGEKTDRVESDPRPYVAGVRQFCAAHEVALADASLRWGHLVKEGIPYTTLLSNSINHPNDRGHRMFADALMELFG